VSRKWWKKVLPYERSQGAVICGYRNGHRERQVNCGPVKYARNQVGFNVGKPRLPLAEPDEKTAAVIRETLKKYTIDIEA